MAFTLDDKGDDFLQFSSFFFFRDGNASSVYFCP